MRLAKPLMTAFQRRESEFQQPRLKTAREGAPPWTIHKRPEQRKANNRRF